MRSHVFYSDDHGATWRLGGRLGLRTDESIALEAADGSVYLAIRSYEGKSRRAFAWSKDGGQTWLPAQLDDALVDPCCQASIVRLSRGPAGGVNRVLFSNAASAERERMTVRISYDECRTWSAGKVLWEGPTAYSDLCVAPDGTICCLYERGGKSPYDEIALARFSLEWLTDGKDHP